jgi:hypothetical protein
MPGLWDFAKQKFFMPTFQLRIVAANFSGPSPAGLAVLVGIKNNYATPETLHGCKSSIYLAGGGTPLPGDVVYGTPYVDFPFQGPNGVSTYRFPPEMELYQLSSKPVDGGTEIFRLIVASVPGITTENYRKADGIEVYCTDASGNKVSSRATFSEINAKESEPIPGISGYELGAQGPAEKQPPPMAGIPPFIKLGDNSTVTDRAA